MFNPWVCTKADRDTPPEPRNPFEYRRKHLKNGGQTWCGLAISKNYWCTATVEFDGCPTCITARFKATGQRAPRS